MPESPSGYVHSVITGGAVDGPGLRFVIFTTGCPLRCLFCHNPDTRNLKDGKLMNAADLVEEASHYADFMNKTGGGVTVTGGEPLFQQEFVTAIFKGCKERGMTTALDTSGYLGQMTKQELLDVTDLVLLDIKSFDPETYRRVTGMNLQTTLDFAERMAALKKPMWVRCVIVPGLTDDLEMLKRLAAYLKPLGNVEKIEVLPFHKMGEPKWKALGYNYTLTDTPEPTSELIETVRSIFREQGFTVL